MITNSLTIAGSDPSGGAGIQADLKTFSAQGAYGMAVITALTAQNTRGVRSVHVLDPAFVAEQMDTIFEDIRVDSTKIGMVASAGIVAVIADRLRRYNCRNVVLDPVMIAKSGDKLLADDAIASLRTQLIPQARLITPNLPEAAALVGGAVPGTPAEMTHVAHALHALGSEWVLLKGGHLPGPDCTDILFDGETVIALPGPRIVTRNTHGTGCTISSAVAALLPRMDMVSAVRQAKAYVTGALAAAAGLDVGTGHGPVHHFHLLWERDIVS